MRGGETVGREFMAAGKMGKERGQQQRDGRVQEQKKDQAGMGRHGLHAECLEKSGQGQCLAHEKEQHPCLRYGEQKPRGDVSQPGVADFVGQDGFDLVRAVSFDERVVERDAFFVSKPGEERVGLGGAFGPVHDENSVDSESGPFGQSLKLVSQFSIIERREGVEKGHDEDRGQVGHGQGKKRHQRPAPDPGRSAQKGKKPEQRAQQRQAQGRAQSIPFELVDEEGFSRGCVEAELGFDDKGSIINNYKKS